MQRERAAAAKTKREEADLKKRQSLKAAYLKKQVQLMKQAKSQPGSTTV